MSDFEEYWKKLKCKDCVAFHVCSYFKCLDKTRIVISECPYFQEQKKEKQP